MNRPLLLISVIIIFASRSATSENVSYLVIAEDEELVNTAADVEYYLKRHLEKRVYTLSEISTREIAVFEDDINRQNEEAKKLIAEGKRLYEELKIDQCFFVFQKVIHNMEKGSAVFERSVDYQLALMYLGAIYYLKGDTQSSESIFKKLLIYNNKYNPEPDYFPPDIIDVFEKTKGDVRNTRKGTLLVNPKPESTQVFLNGIFMGAGTLKIDNLPTGEYLIGLRKRGYLPYTQMVVVYPGPMEVINIELIGFSEIIDRYTEISRMKNSDMSVDMPARLQQYCRRAGSDILVILFLSGRENSFVINGYTYYKDRLVAYNDIPVSLQESGVRKKTIRLKVEEIVKNILPEDISKVRPVEKITHQKFYTTWWFYSIVGATLVGAGALGYLLLSEESRENNSGTLVISF